MPNGQYVNTSNRGLRPARALALAGAARSCAPRLLPRCPRPPRLKAVEGLRASRMGVDRQGNLWAWKQGSVIRSPCLPAAERSSRGRRRPPKPSTSSRSGASPASSKLGTEIRWSPGSADVVLPLAAKFLDICWIGRRRWRSRPSPTSTASRSGSQGRRPRPQRRPRAGDRPGTGSRTAPLGLLRCDPARRRLFHLRERGRRSPGPRPRRQAPWRASLGDPDREEIASWLRKADAEARKQGAPQRPIFLASSALDGQGRYGPCRTSTTRRRRPSWSAPRPQAPAGESLEPRVLEPHHRLLGRPRRVLSGSRNAAGRLHRHREASMIDRQRCVVALLVVVIALCAALSVGATSIRPENQPVRRTDRRTVAATAERRSAAAPPRRRATASPPRARADRPAREPAPTPRRTASSACPLRRAPWRSSPVRSSRSARAPRRCRRCRRRRALRPPRLGCALPRRRSRGSGSRPRRSPGGARRNSQPRPRGAGGRPRRRPRGAMTVCRRAAVRARQCTRSLPGGRRRRRPAATRAGRSSHRARDGRPAGGGRPPHLRCSGRARRAPRFLLAPRPRERWREPRSRGAVRRSRPLRDSAARSGPVLPGGAVARRP